MIFGRGLDKFIRFFFICGLNCYPSFDGFLTKTKRAVHYIPTGVLIFVTVFTTYNTAFSNLLFIQDSRMNLMLYFIYYLSPMLTVLVCAIQIWFLSSYFAEICSRISIIESVSWRKITCNSTVFNRHFLRRVFIILAALVVPELHKLCTFGEVHSWKHYSIAASYATLKAIIFLALLQPLLYIDVLDYMLQSFIRHVKMRAATETTAHLKTIIFRRPAAKQLAAEISHFKRWHFVLWEISEKINHLFGWTIVVIFLHNSMFVIWNLILSWLLAFEYINRETGVSIGISRKWIFIMRLFFSRVIRFYSSDSTIESLSYAISTIILVDSCHRCSSRVICSNIHYSCIAFCYHCRKSS